MEHSIWAIPGFLGLPSDWDFLKSRGVKSFDWQTFSWNSLTDWAAQFNQWISQHSHGSSLLIGYSFGGRLALHALIDRPELWQGAVLISTHPGLTHASEKQKRIVQDRYWAERFANEDWPSLIKAWNSQNIFSHDADVFERKEEDYKRSHLMRALIQGSLGNQDDLRGPIHQLNVPILWLTGSLDLKYSTLAKDLKFNHPLSRQINIEGAGHRLSWSKSHQVGELIGAFLQDVDSKDR